MSKEASMTFRVEPELREDFNEAAEADRRPAAQVLRELMRSYVLHVRQRGDASELIEPRVRDTRRSHFDAAIASVALEGFSVPSSYKSEAERFIRGDIDFDSLTSKVNDLARAR